MYYYYDGSLPNYNLNYIEIKTSDNLAVVTGYSGNGKSLLSNILHQLSIYSVDSSNSKMPKDIVIFEPNAYVYETLCKFISIKKSLLLIIDDLDGFINNRSSLTYEQKINLLNSILNSPNEIIVVCKKVPDVFKLPDRFFYNLVIKDGVATLEQTLREGLHGVVKNNYVL